MYIRRIKNKLAKGQKDYGYYWYKSERVGKKVVGKFIRKATEKEVSSWLKKKDKAEN